MRRRLWLPSGSGGTYRLEFDLGIQEERAARCERRSQPGGDANSVLQVGATKETVEVTSEAPLVDTTSTQLGAIMDARQVANLPLNTRDTYQLLQLQRRDVDGGIEQQYRLRKRRRGCGFGEWRPWALQQLQREWRRRQRSVRQLPTFNLADSIEEFRVITNTSMRNTAVTRIVVNV